MIVVNDIEVVDFLFDELNVEDWCLYLCVCFLKVCV